MENYYIIEKIKEIVKIKKEKKIILWGSAFLGMNIKKILQKYGNDILCFWDSKADEIGNIDGISVVEPLTDKTNNQTLIIVCIGNNILRKKLREKAIEHGFTNILSEEMTCLLFRTVLEIIDDEKNNKKNYQNGLDNLTLDERLACAVDYAIESDYEVWNKQYEMREWTRISENLILHGAGSYSNFYIDYCKNNGLINLRYLCDSNNNLWGKSFNGLECINPRKLKDLNDVVVILLDNRDFEGISQLDELGIKYFTITQLERNVFDTKFSSDWFRKEKDKILNGLDIFNDDLSKLIYVETICNRIAPHLSKKKYYELKSNDDEYFNKEIFTISDQEYMLDAGAYTGDSIMKFLSVVKNRFGAIYSFELDSNNYRLLKNRVMEISLENIYIYNKGLYSTNSYIPYDGDSEGAFIAKKSNRYAEVVKIDDVLKDKIVTLIKMDIEGAEMDALYGAENTIKIQKPKIAISVYHHLYDIWRIPAYLKSLNGSYKFKLRHHGDEVWDTDCYAY